MHIVSYERALYCLHGVITGEEASVVKQRRTANVHTDDNAGGTGKAKEQSTNKSTDRGHSNAYPARPCKPAP